jgi:Domain of unknown function (DUF4157)
MQRFEHRREHQPELPAVNRAPPSTELRAVERLASTVGNQAFGAAIADGAGMLADGRAHPDIEAAIARSRGTGALLDRGARERFAPVLGDSLADVRVHTDGAADALARSVSARAFTTGADLYFAHGEYKPGSSAGDGLLAHELTHVVQQRSAPTTGPLQVSQPNDSLEVEADAVTGDLVG